MAGISSEAAKGTDYAENKKGFNGNELQSKEFSDLSGLAWYDFNARTYDPQTGRFIQIDPTPEDGDQESLTPYHFTGNNPIRFDDPNGKCGWCDEIYKGAVEVARTFNTYINPLTPFVELVSGKSVESDFTEAKPRTTSATEAAITLIPGAKIGGTLLKAGEKIIEKTVEKTIIKTAAGTEIKGFVKHGVDRAVQRGIKPAAILDALKKPLKTGKVAVDDLGRQSQRYVGKTAEVVVNPETGKIISVNATSTKKAEKLIKKAGEQ